MSAPSSTHTPASAAASKPASAAAAAPAPRPSATAPSTEGIDVGALLGKAPAMPARRKYVHEGREIYEWEQNLEEVHVYTRPPPGVKASMIDCKITTNHLRLGLKGNPPFIDDDLGGGAVVGESMWMIEDGELHVVLTKARKGETWPSALAGHDELDPLARAETQKKMLLERFQQENPGFDFSGAEINGSVPDPRTFMGGVKY